MRKSFFKILRLCGILWVLRLLKRKNEITVLCFHRISNEFAPAYPPIKVEVFEKILQYIVKNYVVISTNQINMAKDTCKKKIILTFDDGYKDFESHVLPLLNKFNLPATLGIITLVATGKHTMWTQRLNTIVEAYYKASKHFNFKLKDKHIDINFNKKSAAQIANDIYKLLINEHELDIEEVLQIIEKNAPQTLSSIQMLNIEDIKKISDAGVEIASHTMTHKILTQNNNDFEYEIKESKNALEVLLCKDVSTIIFPNGAYNEKVLDYASTFYRHMYIVDDTTFIPENSTYSNAYIIPRIMLHHQSVEENLFKIEKFHFLINKLKSILNYK